MPQFETRAIAIRVLAKRLDVAEKRTKSPSDRARIKDLRRKLRHDRRRNQVDGYAGFLAEYGALVEHLCRWSTR